MIPQYEIRVDWNADGDFDDSGEDITQRALDRGTPLTIRYGRDQARLLSPLAPGRAQIEVDNTSRDYSPENSTSPLAGNVRPGRDVRIQARLLALNANPSFEIDTAGWSAGNATIARSTVRAHHGAASLLITPDGVSGSGGAIAARVPVVEGQTYYASLWAWATEPMQVGPAIDWHTALSGGSYISTGFVGPITVPAGEWTFISGPLVAPAGAAAASARARHAGTPTAAQTWWADDVTIRDVPGSLDYGLLRAFLDDFEVLPDIEQRSVQFTCLDALQKLKDVHISTGLYHGLRTGQAIAVVLDAVGWPEDLRDLEIGATTIPWFWAEGRDALTVLQEILDSEGPGSLATVDIDGNVVFRDRHHRLLRTTSTTVQATFRASGTEPCVSALTYDHGWKGIVNSLDFSVPIRRLRDREPVWSMDGVRSIADGETAAFVASASEPFSGAATPEAGRDFRLLSGAVTVSLSRTSGQAVVIFVGATGGSAVIADLQLRARPLRTQAIVQIRAEDTASVGRYGRRSWSDAREPVWACPPDIVAIADIILAHRAERLPTVTITLQGGDPTRLTQQLSRDLSDRIHIVEPETGLDADFWIEQIAHTITELDHATAFGCEMIPTPVGVPFTFDVAGRGFDDGAFGAVGLDDPSTVFIFDHPTQGKFDVGILAN